MGMRTDKLTTDALQLGAESSISAWSSILPAGVIVPYGGAAAPEGWLLCDGSAVSRETYAGLFTAVGTAFGVGDGSTTFNVPDTRGKTAVGKAAAGTFDTLAATGGVETHALSTAELAAHKHTQDAHGHTNSVGNQSASHKHTTSSVGNNSACHTHSWPGSLDTSHETEWSSGAYRTPWGTATLGGACTSGSNSENHTHTVSLNNQSANHNHTVTVNNATATEQNAGSGTAHTNLQPYIVLNSIVKC